jgi:hypothetical protein
MKLEAFSRLIQLEAEKFKEHWLENAKKEPENWPTSMNEGDWWEQFIIHLGTKGQVVAKF